MSRLLSVGIVGAAGFMGAPFSRALMKAHRDGSLRFVILHRPGSDLSRYPKDMEMRKIDFEKSEIGKIAEQVGDLQVVVSASSFAALNSQYRLIDALKDSKELITFFPSEYATPHRPEVLNSPFFAYGSEKTKVVEYCAAKGVPCTVLANATVPDILFNFGADPAFNFKENRLTLYWPLGEGTRGLTSREFSGQALVYLLLHRLHDLPNKTFSLVEHQFSSQDLITLCKKLHNGQEPTIVKYSEEDYNRDMSKDFLSAMGAASKKGLAFGTIWPGEMVSDFPGWKTKSLEEYVRESLDKESLNLQQLRYATLAED